MSQTYQKAKDIFTERKSSTMTFEEWALIVQPNSVVVINAANDLSLLPLSSFANSFFVSASLFASSSISSSYSLYSETSSVHINNADTASYVLNAVSASYAPQTAFPNTIASASWVSASTHITMADTASYVVGTVASATSASYASTSSWTDNVVNGRSIILCSAYTPLISGPDAGEVPVPYSPLDGTTSLTYTIRRLVFRVQTPASSDTSSIDVEKSVGSIGFNAITIGSLNLTSSTYIVVNTGSLGYINSGDLIRFNIQSLGSAMNWTIIAEISSP
jgi:hypothetical protein